MYVQKIFTHKLSANIKQQAINCIYLLKEVQTILKEKIFGPNILETDEEN